MLYSLILLINQLLIKGRKKVGVENLKSPKAFVGYSQAIDDAYQDR